MTTMPAEITYGHVTGRFIAAWTDGPDAGRTPDPRPLEGLTVKITPKVQVRRLAGASPVLVATMPVTCKVDADGRLIDEQGNPGVWLVTGVYGVSYAHPAVTIPAHDIEVIDAHTEDTPLDLVTAMPPGGPVLTASQYAELSARIDGIVVEAGAVSSVNGQTGAVVLDAADVGALPSTYTPPAQSWTQITSKPATYTPTAHVHAIADVTSLQAALDGKQDAGSYAAAVHAHAIADVTGLQTALDGKAATGHTHTAGQVSGLSPVATTGAYADLSGKPTIPGPQTLSLTGSDLTLSDGGGTVTLPSGGGGAAVQTVPGVGTYFLSPWVTSTIDKPVSTLTPPAYVPCGASVTVDAVSVYVQTAQAGAVGTIEVYADAGLRPGALVASITTLDFATTGRKDFTTSLTGSGWWVIVKSTVTNVRLIAAAPVGPGAGIGNASPSQSMPSIAGEYPLLGGTGNVRGNSFAPVVMMRRSA